jgi:hypothetical protein
MLEKEHKHEAKDRMEDCCRQTPDGGPMPPPNPPAMQQVDPPTRGDGDDPPMRVRHGR